MLKKLNIIHAVLLILDLAIIPLVGFLQGFNSVGTFVASMLTILVGHPILYLVMIMIKEWRIPDYESERFIPLCLALTIILGCVIWYAFFHTEFVFASTIGLWYGLVLLAVAIPYILMKIIDYITKNKSKDDRPKIVKK